MVIQLEAIDSEGNYFDDIVGKLLGYDELGFYVGNQKVGYDEIRHIELDHTKKWSDLTDK